MNVLDELEKLMAQATPGPWEADVYMIESEGRVVAEGLGGTKYAAPNAALIAAAVNALPAFVRLARAAQRMCEAQLCGLDILASSHYDDMIEVLEGIEEVKP